MIMQSAALPDELQEFMNATGVRARSGVKASSLTTFAIGGPINGLIEPATVEETARAVAWLAAARCKYRVIGGGSNLLVGDAGVGDWIIKLGRGLRTYHEAGADGTAVLIEAGAAMPLMTLSRELCGQGLAGLEFAGGIPATIGGAVRMNAGAHGGDMSGVLVEATVVTGEGGILKLAASALSYSYRHSELPPDSVVVSAKLRLEPGDRKEIAGRRAKYLAERKARQPLTLPSAGSIFKNPSPQQTAGMLIEAAGLKGRELGGAAVSGMHANWIVNPKRCAKASEVLELMELCRSEVKSRAGVDLHAELIVW